MSSRHSGSTTARCITVLLLLIAGRPLGAQTPDTLSLRFVDADLRGVIQGVGRYLDKPILAVGIPSVRVTFETPRGIDRKSLPALLRGLAEQQGLELTEDSVDWRIRPKPPEQVTSLGQAPGQGPQGTPQLFVVRLKHAVAADIAATVNQLFGGGSDLSGRNGISSPSFTQQMQRQAPQPPAAGGTPGAGSAVLAGPVTVVPDARTNSLLIRATPEDFNVFRQAIDQLDIRPLQVLIEVLIVEVRKDRLFSLGADLTLPTQGFRGGGTVSGVTKGGGVDNLVLRFMRLGGGDASAILRTAESHGDVDIISRPTVLASNNTESRFLVGSQRPFISNSRTLPTDNAARDQVIDYKDVATRLTVRPTINQDGYVSLTVAQEVNNATDEIQFGAPVISTREANTTVLVRDGQTVVIGGLRDRQRDRSSGGIPFLSRIPFIGGLFGGITRHDTETELYLFLTPHIISTDEDADRLTRERMSSSAHDADQEVTP